MNVLLISTYELGRQPFGLASPAAWLQAAGARVTCADLSRDKLDARAVEAADLVAVHLPMHTATRLAMRALHRVRDLNPRAHLAAYGLYAPVNAALLRRHGVEHIVGGEFEAPLAELVKALATGKSVELPQISLERQQFLSPDRTGLPALDRYAHLTLPDGSTRVVGYTEATRGCKHLCRHCPIVPVYNGAFRIVQPEVVLADIRQQVAGGAQHITFGDPDFFNGPAHAVAIVRELHREFPQLTYDVTIKIEHLLRNARLLSELSETGCAFVTSAVESVDDHILELLDKNHTRTDFVRAATLLRDVGLYLVPTFVPFTPWTTLAGYLDLLPTLAELDLVENTPPVQLTIRLLIPAGSRLLELPETKAVVEDFDEELLTWQWRNPDPRVDQLQRELEALVQQRAKENATRAKVFSEIYETTAALMEESPCPHCPHSSPAPPCPISLNRGTAEASPRAASWPPSKRKSARRSFVGPSCP